ncbi:unknown protein [Simkania negevensis Z]|uniref:Uncharacterized protein n=1 Tax=Simkania negevensis (strain ATCC VR-1471 / DSM 27360 / Z) TaxID=331113 RepID=F8L511_SIMNZ|nr:unknown protein [Simkania negevensis Z]
MIDSAVDFGFLAMDLGVLATTSLLFEGKSL